MSRFMYFLPIFLTLQFSYYCNGDINIVQSTDLNRPLIRVEHGWDDVTPNFWLPDELSLMMVDPYSDSCSADLSHPPKNVDSGRKWILLTSDLNCAVDDIVVNAMRRRYKAVVIYPFGSDNYELKVSPSLKAQLTDINVYFVDKTTGKRLRKFAYPFKNGEKFFVKFGKMATKPSGGYQKPKFEQPKYQKPIEKRDDITGKVILGLIAVICCAPAGWMIWSEFGPRINFSFNRQRPAPQWEYRQAPPRRSPSPSPDSTPPPTPPPTPPRHRRRAPSPQPRPPPPPKREEVAEEEPGFMESFVLLDVNFTTTSEQVGRAWRIKCRPFHPDQNLGQPQDIIDQRAKEFRRLTRAKEKVLSYLENKGK